ncbi:MAG TPA: MAPEG family protein, partial [Steroidobacteraceae bacterium]|nr:MAPEG family protein [Steroidobacteraceae bacterium]
MGETMQNVQSADHFRNLFEVPVLFYALCGYLAITQYTSLLLLACAWGFVAL